MALERGFRVDMHVHTMESGDNDAEPEAMLQAALRRGLHGIVFTEHYYYGASEYAEHLAERYKGRITVFRGVEFSALEGHCLVYGVDTDRMGLSGAPAQELVKRVKAEGGLVIPAHPFRGGSGIGNLLNSLSGIIALEGLNGCNLHGLNKLALEAAKRLGLYATGGSDAHSDSEVAYCYTEFEAPVGRDGLVAALKSGRYQPVDTRKISRVSWPYQP